MSKIDDDRELLKDIKANNQKKINKFYDSIDTDFVRYFKKNYGKSEDYSMDLLQDSILSMYENILSERLTPDNLTTTLYQYLLGIAIRKMQAGDRKTHELETGSLYHLAPDGNYTLDSNVLEKVMESAADDEAYQKESELIEFVAGAVSRMGPPCHEILTYFYWDRLSCDEIANTMTNLKNADSVKTQKFKCMRKIKPIIEQYRNIWVTN